MSAEKTKKTRRSVPLFYIIFWSVIALFIIALAVGLSYLWGLLADYEASLPKTVAESVFNEYFASPDPSRIAAIDGAVGEMSPLEGREQIERYISEVCAGNEMRYDGMSGSTEEEKHYAVSAGETRLAEFTVSVTGEKSEHGNPLYALSGMQLLITAHESVKIKAPDDCTVKLNGHTLDESYLVEKDIADPLCEYLPEGVRGIHYCVYSVSGLVYHPEVTVTDKNGAENPLAYDEDDKCYTASPAYSEKLKSEQSARLITAMEKYSMFMAMDARFEDVSPYLEYGTELYRFIKIVANYFVTAHDGYEFIDETAEEFYAYDEDTFSCRVAVTQVLKKAGRDDYHEKIDMTLVVRKKGDGEYLIYNRYNN